MSGGILSCLWLPSLNNSTHPKPAGLIRRCLENRDKTVTVLVQFGSEINDLQTIRLSAREDEQRG